MAVDRKLVDEIRRDPDPMSRDVLLDYLKENGVSDDDPLMRMALQDKETQEIHGVPVFEYWTNIINQYVEDLTEILVSNMEVFRDSGGDFHQYMEASRPVFTNFGAVLRSAFDAVGVPDKVSRTQGTRIVNQIERVLTDLTVNSPSIYNNPEEFRSQVRDVISSQVMGSEDKPSGVYGHVVNVPNPTPKKPKKPKTPQTQTPPEQNDEHKALRFKYKSLRRYYW